MSTYESDAEVTVRLLRDVGLRRLMGSDGCYCGWVTVRYVSIDRSCRKSGSSLRVHERGDEYGPAGLALVAAEALRQMREEDSWSDILVRYCDYTTDHKGSGYVDGKWVRSCGVCVYCGKPRSSLDDYLCPECKTKEIYPGYPIAERYDYSPLLPHGIQLGDRPSR